MLGFEDRMLEQPDGADPIEGYSFPLIFTWALPPLRQAPDLLVLATELAGLGGIDLPLEVLLGKLSRGLAGLVARGVVAELGEVVGEHQHRIADLDGGVHQLAARPW